MNRRQLAVAAGASMCGLAQPSVALSSSTRDIGRFSGEVAPAMITGVAAHAIARQPSLVAAAAGLALQTHAHAGGWPIPG